MYITTSKTEVKKKYDWKHGNYEEMKKYMANTEWGEIENLDINNGWSFIKNKIQESIELYIPEKNHRQHHVCIQNYYYYYFWFTLIYFE